ncbi:MAG: TadE/TadG family type IV pilus assembly protein [Myxococcota bacterium]
MIRRMIRRRNRHGAAAIEFALMLPPLMLTFGGVLELSNYMTELQMVARAARDGARVGSITIEGTDPDGTEIIAAAEAQATLVLETAGYECDVDGICLLTTTWELDPDTGYYFVDLEVSVPYQSFTQLLPQLGTRVRADFTMMTQQQ